MACDTVAQTQLATRIRAACKEATIHVDKGRMRRACGRACNRDAAEGREGHRPRLVAVETGSQPAAAAGSKGARDALVVDEDRVLVASGDCVHLMREAIGGHNRQSEVINEDRVLVASGDCVHECGVHLPDSRRQRLTPHDFHWRERPSTQLASTQLAVSAVTKCVRDAGTREHERMVRAARERERAESTQLVERSREELRGARAVPKLPMLATAPAEHFGRCARTEREDVRLARRKRCHAPAVERGLQRPGKVSPHVHSE
jgi:hypothetical protein